MERIAVLGAGSWGTTLAALLAEKEFDVALWARTPELARAISKTHENQVYLPGLKLPERLRGTSSLEEALKGATMVVNAIPSHGIRKVFEKAGAYISGEPVIVSAAKGIEEGTLRTPSWILKEVLPELRYDSIVVLSGPSFALEVSRKLPAAVSAASASAASALKVQQAFSTESFRVYTNTDTVGVEVGGALKNVVAIASGISDGLKLGCNARAALITRGLAEMTRLGVRMGGHSQTFAGLSGLGDLVLTCTGALSRNYTVGVEIGRGRSMEDVVGSMRMVAEGVKTSNAVKSLAFMHGVEMPIAEEVWQILYNNKPAKEAVLDLMTRELKSE